MALVFSGILPLGGIQTAHAATTYTLEQVGGTAQVKSFTYQGTQVKGYYPPSTMVVGTHVIPARAYWNNPLMMGVNVKIPLTQVNKGDVVTVPLTAPPYLKSIFSTVYSANAEDLSIDDVKVAHKFVSGSRTGGYVLNFRFLDGVTQFSELNVNTTLRVEFDNLESLMNPEDVEYDYDQMFVGIGAHKFMYEKEPYTPDFSKVPECWNVYAGWATGLSQQTDHLVMSGTMRPAGLMNYVLRGDYDNKTPQVNANQYAVYRLDTLSGANVSNAEVTLVRPVMAENSNYFSDRSAGQFLTKPVYTQKSLAQDALLADFNAVETLLAPGEYAIVHNTDGTIDVAFNFGPLYNNPRNKFPDDFVYDYATEPMYSNPQATNAKANANVEFLRANGYGNSQTYERVQIRLNNEQYSQAVSVTTWTKIYDQTKLLTNTGYWDATAGTSSGGTVAQTFITYRANGNDVTGAAPANTVGNVGATVSVGNQNGWKRNGYSFNGWNTKADGTGTAYAVGAPVTLSREGLILYAQWKPNNYSVTFNGNGNTGGSTAALTGKAYGSKVTLTANGFTRTGYTFRGWNTKADGTGASYADKAQFTIPAGNTTLYAQWLSDSVVPGDQPRPTGYVTVTFAGGANGRVGANASYHVDPTKNVTLVPPTVTPNTGYAFSRWSAAYTNVKFTQNTTITAQYTEVGSVIPGTDPNPGGYVKVAFSGGASGSLSGTTSYWVNPNKNVTLTAPTVTPYTGYKFTKWSAGFTNVKFAQATTITAEYGTVDDVVPGDQPKPAGYSTVTFDGGAHGKLSGATSYHVNPSKTVILAAPAVRANNGYTFAKWDKAFSGVKFAEDTTITAQYNANNVTVKFEVSNGTLKGTNATYTVKVGDAIGVTPAVTPATGYAFGNKWVCSEGGSFTSAEVAKYVPSGANKTIRFSAKCENVTDPSQPLTGNTEKQVDQKVNKIRTDEDLAGSTFGILQLRGTAKGATKIKLNWTKPKGAAKYVVYGAKCGKTKAGFNKYKKLKTLKAGKKTITLSKIKKQKIQKGKSYKFFIVAYDKKGKVIATSKTLHIRTDGGKYGNFKSVKVTNPKSKKVKLAVGKTKKIKAKAIKKKKPVQVHRKLKFESSNPKIATVGINNGKIKAKKKGSCYIYVYAQSGQFAKIKVTVK